MICSVEPGKRWIRAGFLLAQELLTPQEKRAERKQLPLLRMNSPATHIPLSLIPIPCPMLQPLSRGLQIQLVLILIQLPVLVVILIQFQTLLGQGLRNLLSQDLWKKNGAELLLQLVELGRTLILLVAVVLIRILSPGQSLFQGRHLLLPLPVVQLVKDRLFPSFSHICQCICGEESPREDYSSRLALRTVISASAALTLSLASCLFAESPGYSVSRFRPSSTHLITA